MPPYGGRVLVSVASTTPGSAFTLGSNWLKKRCFSAAVLYWPLGNGSRATRIQLINRFPALAVRLAGDFQVRWDAAVRRQRAGLGGIHHSRKRLHPGQQLAEEALLLGGSLILAFGKWQPRSSAS